MKNKKIAFICPTHTPHFVFAKSLISSFVKNGYFTQCDLWFVFTNVNEADNFGNYDYKLILPSNFCIFDRNGIINIKKIWAVKYLYSSYQYLITIDSETLFTRNIDLLDLCNNFFENKILLGNKVLPQGKELTEKIKKSCKEFFPNDFQDKLDSEFYLWFNQPCIYKTANIDKFFAITRIYEKLTLIDWFQFDYYVYMYFLILYEQFSIIDMEIESSYGVLESSDDLINIKSCKYKKLRIMNCTQKNFYLFDNSWLFLIIQVDRK